MPYVGEMAGIATALLWALTSIFFSQAGQLIGSFTVNKIRLLIAVLIYALLFFVSTGLPYPRNINEMQLFWLGMSGLVGLVIGDSCGFKALVMIGPRLATLIYASTPIMTTVIAWFFLDERLRWLDLLGIFITIAGITWVVLERRFNHNGGHFKLVDDHPDRGSLLKGVLYALGAALGQALGLVLAKQGMFHAGGKVEPLEASFVRMLVSLLFIWLIAAARGQLPQTVAAMKNHRAISYCAAGALVGPFLGVWMSLVAVKYIATGLAATLNSTTPVMILPLVALWYKEKITLRATLGAAVTVGGVALIVLS
jgi:drug/metabolite transporter (DMT)-like permease